MRAAAQILALLLALVAVAVPAGEPANYPDVRPGRPLAFPRDHGTHADYRSEWWYVTGWLSTADGHPLGFQLTFFRTRPALDDDNPSAFAPRQILFAHAALSDPTKRSLSHAERLARAGFGLAETSPDDTDIVLDDWSLRREPDGRFSAIVSGGPVAFTLTLTPTQPILLQGDQGYSRKGPDPRDASFYFSLPHLRVTGVLGNGTPVSGEAWLDREWSSSLLPPAAVGWDWLGVNLDDGGALTLFQIRGATGDKLWAGGSWRRPDGTLIALTPDQVTFSDSRGWHSPRTGADYPVAPLVSVRLPDGLHQFRVRPLFDDQELDSRPAGPVYWEGAATLEDQGRAVGRGYLELTGYVAPLKF